MSRIAYLLRDRAVWLSHPHLALVLVQSCVGATQLGMSLVVARYWGAAERADLAVVVAVGTLASTVTSRGISDVLIRITEHERVWPLIRLGAARVGLGALVAGAVVFGLLRDVLPAVAVLFVAIGTYFARSVSSSLFGRGMHLAADFTQAIGFVVAFLISLLMGLTGARLSAAWLVPVCSWLPLTVFGLAFASRHRSTQLRPAERMLGNASLAGAFSSQGLLRGDLIWASLLVGTTDLGVYSVAAGMAEAVSTTVGSIGSFALRGRDSGLRLLFFAVVLSTIGSIAIVVLSYVMSAFLLPNEFRQLPVATLALAPGAIAMAVTRVQHGILLRRGGTAFDAALAYVVGIACMLALDYALRSHGVVGLSIASTVAYAACLLGVSLVLRRLTGRKPLDS